MQICLLEMLFAVRGGQKLPDATRGELEMLFVVRDCQRLSDTTRGKLEMLFAVRGWQRVIIRSVEHLSKGLSTSNID